MRIKVTYSMNVTYENDIEIDSEHFGEWLKEAHPRLDIEGDDAFAALVQEYLEDREFEHNIYVDEGAMEIENTRALFLKVEAAA